MSDLGKRLKEARKKKKLTQIEAAKLLGISNGTLSGYERNYRDPDTKTLENIADLYGVSTDYLLGRSDNPSNHHKDDLPRLTEKDEKDIAKQLEKILESMDTDTALAFDGEPMDEETKELVRAAIESNLRLTKQLAKKKFTPKKYRED
ncbi:transcriptional regulator [Anoxybacillus sp. UARK-01]|uniref:helix-turn-helix domain-containing protein n=1 Tax=Anoxybacillus sp. UARK-01 TaxID=1895648 RepID=UPI0009B9E526|nr:helix-turn-helix domain-containing protein [Anoxybacillus sp. UARK-01]OQM47503.1 transcriptional regulator [Anoxybacillus sp. UARK-01]